MAMHLSLLLLMLFFFQLPGEQTRGLKEPPPQEIILRPDGLDIGIHWGELAAICAVVSATYFAVTKLVIAPMIERKLDSLDHRFVTRGDLVVALKASGNEKALEMLEASWSAAEATADK